MLPSSTVQLPTQSCQLVVLCAEANRQSSDNFREPEAQGELGWLSFVFTFVATGFDNSLYSKRNLGAESKN